MGPDEKGPIDPVLRMEQERREVLAAIPQQVVHHLCPHCLRWGVAMITCVAVLVWLGFIRE